eukprot:1146939-Pelagomonas_calceolata.AAC.4
MPPVCDGVVDKLGAGDSKLGANVYLNNNYLMGKNCPVLRKLARCADPWLQIPLLFVNRPKTNMLESGTYIATGLANLARPSFSQTYASKKEETPLTLGQNC